MDFIHKLILLPPPPLTSLDLFLVSASLAVTIQIPFLTTVLLFVFSIFFLHIEPVVIMGGFAGMLFGIAIYRTYDLDSKRNYIVLIPYTLLRLCVPFLLPHNALVTLSFAYGEFLTSFCNKIYWTWSIVITILISLTRYLDVYSFKAKASIVEKHQFILLMLVSLIFMIITSTNLSRKKK